MKRDGILQVPLCALQYGKRLREMDGWDEIKREPPTLMNDIVEYMLDTYGPSREAYDPKALWPLRGKWRCCALACRRSKLRKQAPNFFARLAQFSPPSPPPKFPSFCFCLPF